MPRMFGTDLPIRFCSGVRRAASFRLHFFAGALRALFPVLLFLLFTLQESSGAVTGTSVRVGVYENAPKVFTDDAGRPAGIFIDIIEFIAEEEGWELEYVPGTWNEGLQRLQRGEIDLMPDVAFTAGRAERYRFHSVPVISSWLEIYAPRESGISGISDLNGKTLLVLEGSVQQQTLSNLNAGMDPGPVLVQVPDYPAMFAMVAEQRADAAVTNRFFGALHAEEYDLVSTSVLFDPSDLFFAAPSPNSAETGDRLDYSGMLNVIDRHLRRLKENPDSIYFSTLTRWTSHSTELPLPVWVWRAAAAAAAVLIFSVAGNGILKLRVNQRTAELSAVNRDMERRITERTAELYETMKRAQAADKLKSTFLATMSHELRTPLNSIIGFTGILLKELAGPLNSEQKKQLTMVQTSSRHLLDLINDVLDISKIEAGQMDIVRSSFPVRDSIQKTVNYIRPAAERKGIAVHCFIDDDSGTMVTDQRRFEQVLLNLLNNAVKFTEEGSVTLRCIRFFLPGNPGESVSRPWYRISVADTGIGMKPEETSGLFQPFHQIDSGLSRRKEGTGLGLSISRKLLDLLGGRIELESERGKGSTFTVFLPESPLEGGMEEDG
jgi:signal transduction histidine kinase